MGALLEALDEGVLVTPLDSRHTRVGFQIIPVQVWHLEPDVRGGLESKGACSDLTLR